MEDITLWGGGPSHRGHQGMGLGLHPMEDIKVQGGYHPMVDIKVWGWGTITWRTSRCMGLADHPMEDIRV